MALLVIASLYHRCTRSGSWSERRLESTAFHEVVCAGPGHRWPYVLLPICKLGEWVPQTRGGAPRLGLVTLEQMLSALTFAVENPVQGRRILGVAEIRTAVA
jgi:hypothetical protein